MFSLMADVRHPVYERPMDPNEKAVLQLVGMLGGWDNFFASGHSLEDLIPVMIADEDDELSGLRTITERSFGRAANLNRHIPNEEPMLDPPTVRRWLLRSKQATEADGELVLADNPGHLAMAGLSIIKSGAPGYLTEAYEALPDHETTISTDVVRHLARQAFVQGQSDQLDA